MNPAGVHHRPLAGVALIVLAVTCFAGMDSIVRLLGQRLPVTLILGVRYGIQTVIMALWVARLRDTSFRTRHPRFQFTRGALLLFSSTMVFFGLQHIPVPEITSITLLAPVLVTLLAAWFLHERLTPLRVWLVAGGCIGALVVVRPGSGLFGWVVLFPLAATLTNAWFQLLTARMAALDNPYTTNFYTGATGAALMLPIVLLDGANLWQVVQGASPLELSGLVAIGVLGTVGHLLLVMALGLAPASTLMPLVYVQLGVAALLGWLVFDHLPDAWGWIGMAIIAVCGAATAWLNVRAAIAARRPIAVTAADTVVD